MSARRRAYLAIVALELSRLTGAQSIDNAALNDVRDGENWAAFGRTFDETRYSPLSE
jgi:quinohemoprotein ethanol dehydrogenase